MSQYEPLEGVVDALVKAIAAERPLRDLATTRRGAIELALARHLPSVADTVVARNLAKRIRSGALSNAPLAQGMVTRFKKGASR
jgi:hypothetical protein